MLSHHIQSCEADLSDCDVQWVKMRSVIAASDTTVMKFCYLLPRAEPSEFLSLQFNPLAEQDIWRLTGVVKSGAQYDFLFVILRYMFLSCYTIEFCCEFIKNKLSDERFLERHMRAVKNAINVMLYTLLTWTMGCGLTLGITCTPPIFTCEPW